MIGYSTAYQWSTVRIAVTAEQEARLFAKACEMADVSEMNMYANSNHCKILKEIFYGPNHIKYDKRGILAFLTKWKIIPMHPEDMICNESVAEVMLVEWPDLLEVKPRSILDFGRDGKPYEAKKKDPATLTPDIFEYMVAYYFYINETRLQD
jgi:hypothetical protein